jgi:hypothetical protein
MPKHRKVKAPVVDEQLERRTSARKAVGQGAMLVHSRGGYRLCQVRDLSLRGALLDLGWGLLTRDVAVELTLDLPAGTTLKPFRLPAQVARVSSAGTAVKFRDLGVDAYAALTQFLHPR